MVVSEGVPQGSQRVGARRVVSRGLTLSLAFVVMSSLFTALATFNAHVDAPGFDEFVKVTNLATLVFEVVFILVATVVSLARLRHRQAVEWPSGLELAIYGLLFFYTLAIIALRWPTLLRFESIAWPIHLLVFFALRGAWACGVKADFRTIWRVLVATALIHVALFSYAVFRVPDPESYDWIGNIPGFTNIRHLAYFIAPAAIVLAAFLLTAEKRHIAAIAVGLAILLLYPSWTGGRGAIAAFVAGLIALLAFKGARKPVRLVAVGLALVVALVLPLGMPQIGEWPPLLDRMEQISEQVVSSEGELSSSRLKRWAIVAEAIAERPVFGYGPIRITGMLSGGGINWVQTNPHNYVLQLLLFWGGVGFALTLAFAAVHARRIATGLATGSREVIVTTGVMVTLLIQGQVDGTMYYPFTFILAVLAFFQLWAIGAEAAEAAGES